MNNAIEDLQFRLSFFFGRFAAMIDDYMLVEAERQLVRPPAQPQTTPISAEPQQPEGGGAGGAS
jgi:hypothetical protein